jgi:hypothetical protein
MTSDFVVNDNGTTTINVDFLDENVNLQGETHVKGGIDAATAYLPFFERDMRRNFAELFPLPVMPEGGGREI